jgi:hypothetical protein
MWKWSWHFETTAGGICSSEKWCNIFAGAIWKTTVIPWCYIVGGSETGDISWDRFSTNITLKWGGCFRTVCYTKEKDSHAYFTKNEMTSKWQCKELALLLKYKWVILMIMYSVQHYNCQCLNPWRWFLRNQTLQSGKINAFSSSGFLYSRDHLYSSLYGCCYLLLILVNPLTHLEASSC